MEISIHGRSIPVTAEPSVDIEVALQAPCFRQWVERLDPRFVVRSIHFQSLDIFQNGHVGFLKFRTDTVDPVGNYIPGIVNSRGGVVVILPVLMCEGKEYAVLVVQPRLPGACFELAETPAGIIEPTAKTFRGAAAKEIEEEVGITIQEHELVDLTPFVIKPSSRLPGVFASPGGSDEWSRWLLYRQEVTPEKLVALHGAETGALAEGERITLKIVPIEDAWHEVHTATSVAIILLYLRLRAEGRL